MSKTRLANVTTRPSKDKLIDKEKEKEKEHKKIVPKLALNSEENIEYYSVRWSPDARLLAGGRGDGSIWVFNPSSGERIWVLTPTEFNSMPITSIRWRPNKGMHTTRNVLLAAASDGTARHWHVTTQKCTHTIREDNNQIFALDYRHDAEKFVTAGKDFHIKLYDETTHIKEQTLCGGAGDSGGHVSRIFSVKWISPEQPNILISGGWDNTVQIWDTRVSHAVRSFFGPHICGDSLDYISEGSGILLTGSWRPKNTLQLWDFGSGEPIQTFNTRPPPGQQACLVYAAQFGIGPACPWVVSGGSGANEARIFHRRSGAILGELHGFNKGLFSLDHCPEGHSIALAGPGLLNVYDLVFPELPAPLSFS